MKTLIIVCAIAFVSVSSSLDLCFVIFLHIHVTSLVGERGEGRGERGEGRGERGEGRGERGEGRGERGE